MNEIFEMMDEEKVSYDKQYRRFILQIWKLGKYRRNMEELRKFLRQNSTDCTRKSSVDEVERIKEFVTKEEVVIISVNFEYSHIDIDYVF